MNTETHILAKDFSGNLKNIEIPAIDSKDMTIIKSYIEITRHIQEIDKLFSVFECNLDIMQKNFTLNTNDSFERNMALDVHTDDYTLINALTINYISSAKTLVDSIESFMKRNTNNFSSFKEKYISGTYDKKFSYRLLYNLRNFSQHGHLPVSIDFNNNLCFDLNQILTTPHISLNKKHAKEMKKFKDEIFKKFESYPHIVFTKSIAEFNLCIIEIYLNFLIETEKILAEAIDKLNKLIIRKPELIHKSSDVLNGHIIYEYNEEDENIHLFNPNSKSMDMLLGFLMTVKELKNTEEQNFKVFDNMKIIY